jgi:integrase
MAPTGKRRDSGSGGLYQDARGLWTAAIELPERDGKRRRKVIRRAKKADALVALREARRELDRAGDLATSTPTVEAWMTSWLAMRAKKLKPRTLSTYRTYITKHIVPELGRYQLDKLTPAHVRRLHARFEDRGLSSTSALQAHRILAKALTDAEREGRVGRNVATLLDAPSKAVAKRDALTANEARALLLSVAGDPVQAAHWSVALLAGLRQGERLGLTREAIDLERGFLTVSWQVQRLGWEHGCGEASLPGWPCGKKRAGYCPQRHVTIPDGQEAKHVNGLWMTRPKTKAGWRQVPIAPVLHEVLVRYLAEHQPGPEGLVFAEGGKPVDPKRDYESWTAALKEAGLPPVVLHSARHTTATLLYELGVPERTRVQILGHSSATTTAGYTHVSDPLMHDAMGRLGALLDPRQIQA